ncbi:hypothetical protein ACF0H5_017246 [Mactra antiquata]
MLRRYLITMCSRRSLTFLFYINLCLLGIVLIVVYDLKMTADKPNAQKAYDRWKKIRSDFDAYNKERARQDAYLMKKGRQMDAVVGFDYFNKHKEKSGEEKSHDTANDLIFTANKFAPLNFVPKVPLISDSDIVPYISDNITKEYLKLLPRTYKEKIVILTPVCDVSKLLKNYMEQLAKLSYPHDLISVYFGEDSSSDRTFDMAKLIADDLKNKHGFRDAAAFHFNVTGGIHGDWGDVHSRTSQHERRAHIAQARNRLTKIGLKKGNFDYVLWIDSDIKTLPEDLIQQLMFPNADVTVPSCLFERDDYKRNFDKNSWRETPGSLEDQKDLPKDILLVEGYTSTLRIYLPDLRGEGRIVPLDGVGGCSLLVKASCHKRGLIFPDYVFSHAIETEGLAKMAIVMGYSVVGLPFLEVFHH